MVDVSVQLGPIHLKNPILSASGTFGYGVELERFFHPGVLGGLVGKSITWEPREGNSVPRMAETAAGMLNSIGLQNPGVDRFIEVLLPKMLRFGAPVIANIAGASEDEFVRLAKRLDSVPGIAALELNLSCPNVKEGGTSFSQGPDAAFSVCDKVRRTTRLPIFAKLTPNTCAIGSIAAACERAGADGISAINTVLGMAVDWRKRKAILASKSGGLSGPAIKPIALRVVHEIRNAVKIPIIGIGGIRTAEDVLEFIVAGATAVQIGTSTFVDPYSIPKILADMPVLLGEAGVASVSELIGTLG